MLYEVITQPPASGSCEQTGSEFDSQPLHPEGPAANQPRAPTQSMAGSPIGAPGGASGVPGSS